MDNQIFHGSTKLTINRVWRIVRIPLAVILVLYVGLVIYRIPAAQERLKTEEVVKKIHAQKLTLADVMGKKLPPQPDSALNNSTIEGIDANGNGIRDDVELAIFKMYPDSVPPERSGSSTRIRAAELQYAMALQAELTQVFNSGTLVATLQQATRSVLCIGETGPKVSFSDSKDTINKAFAITDARQKEVEDLVLNNRARKDKREKIFDYMISHGDMEGPDCDIDPTSLSN